MVGFYDHLVRCFLHNLVILSIHSYAHYALFLEKIVSFVCSHEFIQF